MMTTTSPKRKLYAADTGVGDSGSGSDANPTTVTSSVVKQQAKKPKLTKGNNSTPSATGNYEVVKQTKTNCNSTKPKKTPTTTTTTVEEKSGWTEAQDVLLSSSIRQHTSGEGSSSGKKNWKPIHEAFDAQYPGLKTLTALKRRYQNAFQGEDVEIDDEQKKLFYQSIQDIDNNKVRQEAIGWRFSTLAKLDKPITKAGVAKLLKSMKDWNLDGGSSTSISTSSEKAEEENDLSDGEEEAESKVEVKKKDVKIKKEKDGDGKGVKVKAEEHEEKDSKGKVKAPKKKEGNKKSKVKEEAVVEVKVGEAKSDDDDGSGDTTSASSSEEEEEENDK